MYSLRDDKLQQRPNWVDGLQDVNKEYLALLHTQKKIKTENYDIKENNNLVKSNESSFLSLLFTMFVQYFP